MCFTPLRAEKWYLQQVGMAPYIKAKPRQLSDGQKQRVAIAPEVLGNPQKRETQDFLARFRKS